MFYVDDDNRPGLRAYRRPQGRRCDDRQPVRVSPDVAAVPIPSPISLFSGAEIRENPHVPRAIERARRKPQPAVYDHEFSSVAREKRFFNDVKI